ncbi:MAG: hypothetical protein PW792_16465 [Acidobacteriaceae bacterium]|nr:hypothetical protein [Acidobacteriaceae bacterium]
MKHRAQQLLPLLLCVAFLPLCALFLHPWVEIGIVDDFSYVRTAQVLANTGHIVYNGWATAMLGWQLYVGALMIKLFGFSFAAARVGTLLMSMVTAALMHRLLVRLRITPWNAAAITLAFLASATWLAVTFSFMSDVYGMVAMLPCIYGCVRALQTTEESHAAYWLCFAAVFNTVMGTARQISWLGVLVMVPCTLWLLRRNRKAMLAGVPCTLLCIAGVFACLHWFNRQPYAIVEHLLPPQRPGIKLLVMRLIQFGVQAGFELLLLSLPLLIALLPLAFRNRRAMKAAALWLLFVIVRLAYLHHVHKLFVWEIPYGYNNFWNEGFEYTRAYLGHAPLMITPLMRHSFLGLLIAAELGLIALFFLPTHTPVPQHTTSDSSRKLSNFELLVLFGPCTVAYIALLIPRYIPVPRVLDRYMLFPEFVLLFVAVRLYQERVADHLPRTVWLSIALLSIFYVIGMRDAFSLFNAEAGLLHQVEASGVPRQQIDGGIQFNGWTQIMTAGSLNDPRIVKPIGTYTPIEPIENNSCITNGSDETPVVHGKYVISYDPNACGGRAPEFAPYRFHTFFKPQERSLYMVKGPEYLH